ncbi:hypothetical protein [Aestuariivirga sp.]|uniref:hypothetical protein n=1 Tax=Aestuariivirga sp. TaxID=2650926 RepID=UPI003592E8F4
MVQVKLLIIIPESAQCRHKSVCHLANAGYFNSGQDVIADFSPRDAEKLDISDMTNFRGFSDFIHNYIETDLATGFAAIVVGENRIVLEGVTIDQIGPGEAYSAQDFIL